MLTITLFICQGKHKYHLKPEIILLSPGKPYNAKSDVWAIGCVLYEMCALKRAFEAPTLPALILKIMRGVTSPIPAQYSAGARQLLANLLALEPSKRPSIPEIMSHHWLAPYIFRIPTTVGLIPCTKHTRPVTVAKHQVQLLRNTKYHCMIQCIMHNSKTQIRTETNKVSCSRIYKLQTPSSAKDEVHHLNTCCNTTPR